MAKLTPKKRESNRVAQAKWRSANPERAAEHTGRWRLENPDRAQELNRRWNKLNPERAAANKARWRANNPEKSLMATRKAQKRPDAKIASALRSRLRAVLNGRSKPLPTLQLLGCTMSDLMDHLESKFEPGMTRGNWGKTGWHIDHIFPLSLVDFSDPCEVARATHYTNLRPLWAKENLRKGNRKK